MLSWYVPGSHAAHPDADKAPPSLVKPVAKWPGTQMQVDGLRLLSPEARAPSGQTSHSREPRKRVMLPHGHVVQLDAPSAEAEPRAHTSQLAPGPPKPPCAVPAAQRSQPVSPRGSPTLVTPALLYPPRQ